MIDDQTDRYINEYKNRYNIYHLIWIQVQDKTDFDINNTDDYTDTLLCIETQCQGRR